MLMMLTNSKYVCLGLFVLKFFPRILEFFLLLRLLRCLLLLLLLKFFPLSCLLLVGLHLRSPPKGPCARVWRRRGGAAGAGPSKGGMRLVAISIDALALLLHVVPQVLEQDDRTLGRVGARHDPSVYTRPRHGMTADMPRAAFDVLILGGGVVGMSTACHLAMRAANLRVGVVERDASYRQASAVLPLLDLAQRQAGGWLPQGALDAVAEILEMPAVRVYEVASFYTMFRLRKPGRHVVEVCTTTPCWLRGSDAVMKTCKETLGIGIGETDAAGDFTLTEVECLGACVNAPMMQIGDDYYEDLDPESTRRILEALRKGEKPAPGSQIGRTSSEPVTGPTTLLAKRESA